MGILSAFLGTIIGYSVPGEESNALNGLHGYNNYLVGLGICFCDAEIYLNNNVWYQFGQLVLPMVFSSLFCSFLHLWICNSIRGLTFAYNIGLSVWLAFAVSLGPNSVYCPTMISPEIPAPSSASIEYSMINIEWVFRGIFAGIGQVFFVPQLEPGLTIFCALALGSPIAAFLAFCGSSIGLLVSVLTHSSEYNASVGLDGLSAVLASIALGGFYFVPSKYSFLLAAIGSVLCVPMRQFFVSLLANHNGPSMTFSFCAVATVLFASKWPVAVPPALLHSVERHLISRMRAMQSVAKLDKGVSTDTNELSNWPDLMAHHYARPGTPNPDIPI